MIQTRQETYTYLINEEGNQEKSYSHCSKKNNNWFICPPLGMTIHTSIMGKDNN